MEIPKDKKITCHDIHGNAKEFNADELYLRVAVYGILIVDNKVLLSKQLGGYDFPGGGIETYETIDEALEREFWEETGLKVKKEKLVTCEHSFFIGYKSKVPLNSILLYYTVKKIGGELSIENVTEDEKKLFDIGLPEWIPIDQVDGIKFYNSVDSPAVITKAAQLV